MFNNVNTTNVDTNLNDEEGSLPPSYHTINVIIAILNTMTDTTFSISTKASSHGCIWIQSPHTVDFTIAPDIREILGLERRTVILPASFYGTNVIEITRNLQEIQVYSSIVRWSDVMIPTAKQNNNLLTTMIIDDPTTNYYDYEVDKSKFPSLESFLNFNKKLPGPIFKDEHNGHRITEFVGLRPKMYCLVDEKHLLHNAAKEFLAMS